MNLHSLIKNDLKCPEKVADRVRDEALHQLKKDNQDKLNHGELEAIIKGT